MYQDAAIADNAAILRARQCLQRMIDVTQTLDRSLCVAQALSPMSDKVNYALKRAISAVHGEPTLKDCIV